MHPGCASARLARTLWAIESDGAWSYPSDPVRVQPHDGQAGQADPRVGAGFQALPAGLHPTAIAGFLRTPQTELQVDGRPLSVLEWLRSGGPVEPVLQLIEIADLASR